MCTKKYKLRTEVGDFVFGLALVTGVGLPRHEDVKWAVFVYEYTWRGSDQKPARRMALYAEDAVRMP